MVKRLDKGVAYLQKAILISVLVFVTCTMGIGIISRYVVGLPVWGMDELSGHMAIWLYLIGAAYGTYTRKHIKAEIVQMIIKNPRALAIIRVMTVVFSAVIAGYMTAWSYEYLCWSITHHEIMEALGWPTVYFQVPIFIAAILMVIYFVVEAIGLSREATTKEFSQRGEFWQH